MQNFLKQINATTLIPQFNQCEIKFYTKRYNTVLIIALKGVLPNAKVFLELIDYIKQALYRSNFQKFELFLDLKNNKEQLELAKKLIEINYDYKTEISDNRLIVDCELKEYSAMDSNYIMGLCKNLHIENVYANVEIKNIKNPFSEVLQYISYNDSKKSNSAYSKNKYLENFTNVPAIDFELTLLPKNNYELSKLINPKVKVNGEIFSIESRPTKKSILYVFKITNYKESVVVKCFSTDNLNLKVGDAVEVVGVLTYDDFMKQIVINVTNSAEINKTNFVYEKEISMDGLFEKEETNRTELHVHSIFSTQDGLTPIADYFKNAKNFGIDSLAIVDHENVQNFPDVEKAAKEYGVKPLYGVELNVIDKENYKIFYKGKSTNNHVVGIDIETTGFSGVYDEIIEISAYKMINGERLEYSKLVKLDDYSRLTSKISGLTSISKDMLEENGIDIKNALIGLIDFIDDGIIVAHNATFDVDFLQYKIKQYLGIDKNYSFIDTLNFSRTVLNDGKMKKFALDKVCKKLKIELTEHHRAIYDAKACLEIYYKLKEMLENISVDDPNCPNFGDTNLFIKANSKKQKELLLNFLNEENIAFSEENTAKENTNRVSSIFNFKVDMNIYQKVKIFLESNNSIKVKEAFRVIANYESDYSLLNKLIKEEEVLNNSRFSHVTLLIKNQKGLKELYKLISLSNIHRITPRGNVVFWDDILGNKDLKENVLLGSSCANGLFKKVFEKGIDCINNWNNFDYIEIQPLNTYLSVSDSPYAKENIKDCVLKIIDKCKEMKKLVVADTDAHYIYPNFKQYRDVYINTFGVGGVMHPLYGAKNTGTHVLFSTNHLIKVLKSDYNLDLRYIKKMVLENPKKVSDEIRDDIKIVPDKLYTPNDDFLKDKILDVVGYKVPSIKAEFEKLVYNEVKKYLLLNGINKLPKYIQKRLDKEMNSIIGHGFYIIYYIAYLLVKQSNKDGYVVGSRGSVGSSFVANLLGITEVNSLAPHYRCPKCHFQIYKGVKDIFEIKDEHYRKAVESVDDGFDLPNDVCPICGEKLIKDGHDIPFETFLGFNGDKTPDIDLNFSGEYQPIAHNFCKIVFGEEYAFRAGTIATVASKTAESYLKKYYQKNNINVSDAEASRRSQYLTDVKRTTGQHPGGIIVLPSNMSVYDFTPIQYPANKPQDWFTTHLDYNAIHENVLKMDILGHDDPTILKFLMDLVKEKPELYPFDNPKDIPIDDEKIMTFLRNDEQGVINSLGIPELGTNFVKGMLSDIQPKSFYELVKTSGLSHGTDVWNTNAQELVNGNTEFGKIPFKDVIGCRDDIMVQLLYAGLEPKTAFSIMEFVRKGKVAKDKEKWEEYKKIMIDHKVPKWYIWSCEKIKYMFPKAHAVAYVLSAMRIAWFKANRPLDFYQAFFTVRATVFDTKTISTNNLDIINGRIAEIKNNKNATDVEKDSLPYLETAAEMIKYGFSFKEPIINLSDGTKFTKLNEKCLLMPFSVLDGVGKVTAMNVAGNRGDTPYTSVDDLKARGKADKKFIEALQDLNALIF